MTQAVQLVIVCGYCTRNAGCEHILQEQTLPTAKARGRLWTSAELAFIEGTQEEPLSEVARALDRTYYAVSKARSLLRHGLLQV